jgi:Putative DNA-binding domain
VQRPFDTDWQDLTVEHIERFLATAGDEGLTWEAKGNCEPHRDSIRKAVCGFANAVGGYLIIGAERTENGWRLPGVTFRHEEPNTWLASIVANGGVTPIPRFDVKVFDREDGRRAAVVAVEPVDAAPCITASGIVYQRVSGQTFPVTDQRVLADLIQQGAAARYNAEETALRAAKRLLGEPAILEPGESLFAAGLSAISGPTDKAAVLFSEEFSKSFGAVVTERLQPDRVVRYSTHGSIHQDCLKAWPASREFGQAMTAAAFWDGSVAVVQSVRGNELHIPTLAGNIGRSWKALAEIARQLENRGEAHLAVLVNSDHPAIAQIGSDIPRYPIQRWTEVREPTRDELASVERELERGFGHEQWES